MNRVLQVILGVAAAIVVTTVSSFVAMLVFGVGVCGAFDDTGGPFPAGDSPQGRLCGQSSYASGLEELAIWSIPAGGVLAVVLGVAAWRWGSHRLRYLAAAGLFVMPFLPLVPLAAPSDTCSAAVMGTPGRECETES